MITTPPIYMGQLGPFAKGDVVDQYFDLGADTLAAGEAVASVAFTVKDAAGTTVVGVVTTYSVTTATRVDARLAIPATAGGYEIDMNWTINDGQSITRTAGLWVV